MTSTTISYTATDGGIYTLPLVVADAAPIYPYPVIKYPGKAPASPTIEDFAGAPITVVDFAQGAWDKSASDNGGWGLLGGYFLGMLNAKITMKSMSSTQAALVNALPTGATTNYQMVRLGRGANPNVPLPSFFTGTIDGTDQGHQYAGMQSYETDKSIFGPFTIRAIPGKPGGVPPFETPAWGSYHDTNATWTDFEIDGRNASGVPVTASGILVGPHDAAGTMTYQRGYIHHLAYGAGISHYNETNTVLNFTDMHLQNIPYAGLNFERCGGSTINVVRPNFDNCAVDLVIDSDMSSATVNISDPVLTAAHPKVVVCIHPKYNYPGPDVSPNKQLQSSVTLTVGGVSRPDLIQFVSNYTPKTS